MNIRNQIVLSQVMLPNLSQCGWQYHGGEIMKLMDSAAGAVAIRYAKENCVTARVDELEFHLPIFVGALRHMHRFYCICRKDLNGSPRKCRSRGSGISFRPHRKLCPHTLQWSAWAKTEGRRAYRNIHRKQMMKNGCSKK